MNKKVLILVVVAVVVLIGVYLLQNQGAETPVPSGTTQEQVTAPPAEGQ